MAILEVNKCYINGEYMIINTSCDFMTKAKNRRLFKYLQNIGELIGKNKVLSA